MPDYAPYHPRPTERHGRRTHAGHHLKVYSVRYGPDSLDMDVYDEGVRLALSGLPEARPGEGRPGLGFLILHRGRDMDYVVLAWWDRENELPVRVFVRQDGPWRPARDGESFCVWDLDIIARERDAYVETILGGESGGGVDAYLERGFVETSGESDGIQS